MVDRLKPPYEPRDDGQPPNTPRGGVPSTTIPGSPSSTVPTLKPITSRSSGAVPSGTSVGGKYKATMPQGKPGLINNIRANLGQIGQMSADVIPGMVQLYGGVGRDALEAVGTLTSPIEAFKSITNTLGITDYDAYQPQTSEEFVDQFKATFSPGTLKKYIDAIENNQPIAAYIVQDAGNLLIVGSAISGVAKGAAIGASKSAAAAEAAGQGARAGAYRTAAKAGTSVFEGLNKPRTMGIPGTRATFTASPLKVVDLVGNAPWHVPYVMLPKGVGRFFRTGLPFGHRYFSWGEAGVKKWDKIIADYRDQNPEATVKNDATLNNYVKKRNLYESMSIAGTTRWLSRAAERTAKHESYIVGRAQLREQTNPLYKDEINPDTGEKWGELTKEENEAVISTLNGRAQLVKFLMEQTGLPLEKVVMFGRYSDRPEYSLSIEGARLALDYISENPTMRPEQYERISNAQEGITQAVVNFTQKSVSGFGRRFPLSKDYLSPLPFVERMGSEIKKLKDEQLLELFEKTQESGVFDLPATDVKRQNAILYFLSFLPDEVATDSTMYPAAMRENLEYYKRFRRALNRELLGDAEGNPLPPYDEPPVGPDEYKMTPSTGKLTTTERLRSRTAAKIEKTKAKLEKAYLQLGKLEQQHLAATARLINMSIVDQFIEGQSAKKIAKRMRLTEKDVLDIIKKDKRAQAWVKMQQIMQVMQAKAEIIGKKRAAMTPEQLAVEMTAMQADLDAARIAVEETRAEYEAAKEENDRVKRRNEQVEEYLAEQLAAQEDVVADAEDDHYRAGGDPSDLLEVVPLVDHTGMSVLPEEFEFMAETAANDAEFYSYVAEAKDTLDLIERTIAQEQGAVKEPTRVDAKATKERILKQAEDNLKIASDALINLGATIDPKTGRPVFGFKPNRRGGEYDWWWVLSIRERRRISRELLKGDFYDKDTRGNKVRREGYSIDEYASGLGPGTGNEASAARFGSREYSPEQWTDEFLAAARAYFKAQTDRSAIKKESLSSMLENWDYWSQAETQYGTQEAMDAGEMQDALDKIQEEFGVKNAVELDAVLARADYLAGRVRPEDIFDPEPVSNVLPDGVLPEELAPDQEGGKLLPVDTEEVILTPEQEQSLSIVQSVENAPLDVVSATRRTGVENFDKIKFWNLSLESSSAFKKLIESFESIADISNSTNQYLYGDAARVVTAMQQIVMWADQVRKAKTDEAKIELILNPPKFVDPALAKKMLFGVTRDNVGEVSVDKPNHPITKFQRKMREYLGELAYNLSVIRHLDETYGEVEFVDWEKSKVGYVQARGSGDISGQIKTPKVNIPIPGTPRGGPFLEFPIDTPKEVVLDAIEALRMAIEQDRGAMSLYVPDFVPQATGNPRVTIYGLTKYNRPFKAEILKSLDSIERMVSDADTVDAATYIRTGKADILAGVKASDEVNTRDAKPKDPYKVPIEDIIADPNVRRAAYDRDTMTAMARKQAAAVRKAQTAEKKFQALQEYLDASAKYADFKSRFDELNARRLKKVQINQDKLDKIVELKRNKIPQLKKTLKKSTALLSKIDNSPQYAMLQGLTGKRLLQWALENRFPTEGIAVEVPIFEDGVKIGVEDVELTGPMYLPSGRPAEYVSGDRVEIVKQGLPGWEKLNSEHRRDGDRETVFSIIEVANRLRRDMSRMGMNEAWRGLIAQFGKTAAQVIGEEKAKELWQQATDYALNLQRSNQEALFGKASQAAESAATAPDVIEGATPYPEGVGAYAPGNKNPVQAFEMARREKYGELINNEMVVRGWTAVNPYARIGTSMPYTSITTEAVPGVTQYTFFMPTVLLPKVKEVVNKVNTNWGTIILDAAGRVTSFFKTGTLVLSATWQLGDLISSLIIASATGIPVDVMISRMKQVVTEEYGGFNREGFSAMFNPNTEMPTPGKIGRLAQESQVQDLSIQNAERQRFMGQKEAEQKPPRFLKKPRLAARELTRYSFKLNETINRISRHAFFLEALEIELKKQGTTLERMATDDTWRYSQQSELRDAMERAAESANKWLGDYANLSLAERKWLIPMVPFWAWTKHIHQVFYALGLDHPESIKWYMYMGSLAMNSNPEDDPFGLRSGTFSLLGGYSSVNWLNPFADVLGGPIAQYVAYGDTSAATRSLGPVPRLTSGILGGFDIASLKGINRPAGTYDYTPTGIATGTPLLTRPQEALGYVIQQFPLAQRIANAIPAPSKIPFTDIALGPYARYQTGEARTDPATGQRIQQPGGTLAALGRLAGLPFIPYRSEDQVQRIELSALQRLRTIEAIRRRRDIYGTP